MQLVSRNSWIAKTGQTWKIYVFLSLMVITLALLTCVVAEYNEWTNFLRDDLGKASLALVFTGVGIAAISWVGLVVKCPACKANVGKF